MELSIQCWMLSVGVCVLISDVCSDRTSERFRFPQPVENLNGLKPENLVSHMQLHVNHPNILLFADGAALKSYDGTTTHLLAGSSNNLGYKEGFGAFARFQIITSFVQLDSKQIVVTDRLNHCLRIITLSSRTTESYFGNCTQPRHQSGLDKLTKKPVCIIKDNQRANKLIFAEESDAIRELDTLTKTVKIFFHKGQHGTLKPYSMTQHSKSGDIYMTSQSGLILRILYKTRKLGFIAGPKDGISNPLGVLLIDDGSKVLVADTYLRVTDRCNKNMRSFCPTSNGTFEGEEEACGLNVPTSLLVNGTELLIGESRRITNIKGEIPPNQPTNSFTGCPEVVTAGTTRSKPSTTKTPITSKPQVISPTETCRSANITKYLKPGEDSVDVKISATKTLVLGEGIHIYKQKKKSKGRTETCQINISVLTVDPPKGQDECLEEIRAITSPLTGTASVDMRSSDQTFKVNLPIGTYSYDIVRAGKSCPSKVRVFDYRVVRRLEFRANYDIDCSLLAHPVTRTTLMETVRQHYDQINRICHKDCKALSSLDPELVCTQGNLAVSWPTVVTYNAATTKVPAKMRSRLMKKLQDYPILKIVVTDLNPPVVLPIKALVALRSSCTEQKTYIRESDSCE